MDANVGSTPTGGSNRPVAQPAERLSNKEEVAGANPAWSTSLRSRSGDAPYL